MKTYTPPVICSIIWIVSSVVTLIVAASLFRYLDETYFDEILYRNLALTNSSERGSDWARDSNPVLVKFYFFEVINGQKFKSNRFENSYNKLVVPVFAERGPYVYEEIREKTEVKWFANGTVSFIPKLLYRFREDLSAGSEEDTLIVLNALIVSAIKAFYAKWDPDQQLRYTFPKGRHEVEKEEQWNHKTIIPRLKVKDMIFGHPNTKLTIIHEFVKPPAADFPEQDGMFGFTAKKSSEIDEISMYTGEKDITKLGAIYRRNGKEKLTLMGPATCERDFGSDPFTFPPNIKPDVELNIFDPNMCRPLPLRYKENRVHKDLAVHRFKINETYFSPDAEANNCYCDRGSGSKCRPRSCGFEGTISTTNCKSGYRDWPLLYSKPHFLHGDVQLRDYLPVMKPNEANHDSYIDFVPKLGIAVSAKIRMQLNIKIENDFNKFYAYRPPHFGTIKEGIYPLFWFERGFDSLPETRLNKIRSTLNWPTLIRWSVSGTLLILSLIFAGISFLILSYWPVPPGDFMAAKYPEEDQEFDDH